MTFSVTVPIENDVTQHDEKQTCPYCNGDFSGDSLEAIQTHELICEEMNADDWIQRADGSWGRTRASKLPYKFGAIRVGSENGVITHRLEIVPAGYCHECGHVHALGHYCAGSSTCEKTERESRREFLFRRMLK